MDNFCKCGHIKTYHKKNPKSKWVPTRFCNKCPCTVYQNNRDPTRSDLFVMLASVIGLGFFMIMVGFISISVFELSPTEKWNLPVEDLTQGEFLTLLVVMLILVIVILCYLLDEPIVGYFKAKKRPTHPAVVE